MGCYDAVGSAEKRIGLEHRLNAYNVASEAAEKSAVQGGPYISFVDDGSSGYIDKDRSFIKPGQGVFVDDLSCVICKRAVERDDIGAADPVFESKALNGCAAYVNGCSDKRCVVGSGGYGHAESISHPGDSFADLAKADYVKCLACKFCEGTLEITELGASAPVAVHYGRGVKTCKVGEFKEQGHRVLGCGESRIFRNVGYGDTVISCCLKVNNVVTCGKDANVFEVRELVEDFLVEDGLVGDGNFSALHSFYELVF